MTTKEVRVKIESVYGWLTSDEKETLQKLLKQARRKWERSIAIKQRRRDRAVYSANRYCDPLAIKQAFLDAPLVTEK